MAETLPSPPATRETSPQNSLNQDARRVDLTRHLDDLLERYLEVLDRYTMLREELSKTLSSGFLSLAHAQRISNLGSGRRYGRDGYDGRMKATKRVTIGGTRDQDESVKIESNAKVDVGVESEKIQSAAQIIRIVPYKPPSDSQRQTGPDSNSSLQKSDSGDAAELKIDDASHTNPSIDAESKPKKSKVDPSYRDPATWYSILVPQPLRQAQKHFSKSIEEPVPQLLHAVSCLADLEDQIRATRKQLGTRGDEDSHA